MAVFVHMIVMIAGLDDDDPACQHDRMAENIKTLLLNEYKLGYESDVEVEVIGYAGKEKHL